MDELAVPFCDSMAATVVPSLVFLTAGGIMGNPPESKISRAPPHINDEKLQLYAWIARLTYISAAAGTPSPVGLLASPSPPPSRRKSSIFP